MKNINFMVKPQWLYMFRYITIAFSRDNDFAVCPTKHS